MIRFLVRDSARWGIEDYLGSWGRSMASEVGLLTIEGLTSVRELSRGTYVLTQIDDLLRSEREVLQSVWEQLCNEKGVRLINHPARTLGRYLLLQTLANQGSNDFRAFRATGWAADLRFPVFVREERFHTGSLTSLLHTQRELEEALGHLLLRGQRLRDLLVVEHCDSRDDQGFYRRYSAFVVGQEIIPRALLFSTHWMVKGATKVLDDRRAEQEFEYVQSNPHASWLRGVFDTANIEYGRIDYGFRGDRPQVWEINLHPTLVASPTRMTRRVETEEDLRRPSRALFFERFEAALKELRAGSESGGSDPDGPVPVHIGDSLAARVLSERRRESARAFHRTAVERAGRWRILRPLRPAFQKLASILAGPLGRSWR
ncbi:MAG: hypothetical protein HKO65_10175 [Gemmatimonadetes bacterium]|nr:hypothetical protein [Gemmatimonadota bacterium]NNM05458.1 hypothetical protein [Gemmatimonadota bacterium]